MKATAAIAILAALSHSASAVPLEPREQAGFLDLFGAGINTAGNIFGTGVLDAAKIFGGGLNLAGKLFGGAFDGASCIVSSAIGGRGPLCGGRASIGANGNIAVVTKTSSSSGGSSSSNNDGSVSINTSTDSSSFTFSYNTEQGDKIKITIKPDAKGKKECVTVVEKKGEIKDLVQIEANKCLA